MHSMFRKTKCTGKQQASAIDWMVTNTPEKYTRAGVTWMGTGADHALVWAERSLQKGLGQKRRTRKRIWKKYTDDVKMMIKHQHFINL